MKKLLQQDVKELGKRAGSAVWFLGEHAFALTLSAVVAAALVAALVFWQYAVFPEDLQKEAESEFALSKDVFERLIARAKEQEIRVERAGSLFPDDLFNP